MESVYDTLEASKIGVFESPTGTGKSLSLICGSFKWLRDHESKSIDELLAASTQTQQKQSDDSEPDWVLAFEKQKQSDLAVERVNRFKVRRAERELKLQRIREEEKLIGDSPFRNKQGLQASKKRKATDDERNPLNDDDVLVDDYYSDDDPLSKSQLYKLKNDDDALDADDMLDPVQIIYCARTHSQIAQFVNEIKKTEYSSIKCISLGSRKTMCINQSVTRLQSLTKINDRCIELHKSDSKSSCPYHHKDKQQMTTFEDLANANIRDIEELVTIGQKHRICPYYGARHASTGSEIICVPYNLLLQKSARESIGLRLKGNVVILDEAHNIIDTVNSLHSHSMTLAQVHKCQDRLQQYFDRYKTRLSGKNAMYIRQILFILAAFERFVKNALTADDKYAFTGIMKCSEFVDKLKIDHFNLFKIQKYLLGSRLARKLHGFSDRIDKNLLKGKEDQPRSSISPLSFFESFLESLTNADFDGRVVFLGNEDAEASQIKYILMNPADCFADILQEARSVIFAGGTMAPIDDFTQQLLPSIASDRLNIFSCGHVIDSTSLQPVCISTGPTGTSFDFSHGRRSDHSLMDETGKAIISISNVVPGGIVCFFVSYSYMQTICGYWKTTETWKRIEKRKKIFLEPTDANMVDSVLRDYTNVIEKGSTSPSGGVNGGILFAVVSGKLSEGINFADDMGRAVVMVGIPFANITSSELKEKMRYFDMKYKESGVGISGNEYYENICMRAVNQSIGKNNTN